MAVAKKRHTKGSRNQRRMHLFLESPAFAKCEKCGKTIRAHHACAFCGFYRGKEAFNAFARLDRKQKRDREAEIAAAQAQKDATPAASGN